jgi:hypothetical protein
VPLLLNSYGEHKFAEFQQAKLQKSDSNFLEKNDQDTSLSKLRDVRNKRNRRFESYI